MDTSHPRESGQRLPNDLTNCSLSMHSSHSLSSRDVGEVPSATVNLEGVREYCTRLLRLAGEPCRRIDGAEAKPEASDWPSTEGHDVGANAKARGLEPSFCQFPSESRRVKARAGSSPFFSTAKNTRRLKSRRPPFLVTTGKSMPR